jgi:hypothetical protein
MRALILAAALCGCQCTDLAGPVEEPSRKVAGPGVCTFLVEARADCDPADSSATCWDGERPHLVALQYPRLRGRNCAETVYLPEGRTVRKFGCRKRTESVEL